jgi:WD40 repeat protein
MFGVPTVVLFVAAALAAQAPAQDRPVRTFATRSIVHFIAFAPDAKTITGWSAEGFMRWEALSGKEVERQPVILKACGRRTAVLPRSEDGRTITANCGSKLLFFDIVTGEPRGERAIDAKQTPAVYAASADGADFAAVVAGALSEVRLSALGSTDVKTTIRNEQEVQQVSFAPSGDRLATGAVDGVRLWQLPEGRLLHKIPNGTFHAFSADGALIAVERGRDVGVFETATGTEKLRLAAPVSQLRFGAGSTLLAGWNNQQLTVWDVSAGKPVVNLRGDQLVSAALAPDGSLLAVVGMQLAGESAMTTVAVWRLATSR